MEKVKRKRPFEMSTVNSELEKMAACSNAIFLNLFERPRIAFHMPRDSSGHLRKVFSMS